MDSSVFVGTERQLFIDDVLVDSLDGVRRVLHAPQKQRRPVMEGAEPWDYCSIGICGNSVHFDLDHGCFRMWYDSPGGIAYATSADGIHWERPRLGCWSSTAPRTTIWCVPAAT